MKKIIYIGIFALIGIGIYTLAFGNTQIQSDTIAGEQTLKIQSLSKGLIGHWDLSEKYLKSSTVISDLTPYGNDGTITAGASTGFVTDQYGRF